MFNFLVHITRIPLSCLIVSLTLKNTTVGDEVTPGTSSAPTIVKTLMQTLTENVGDSPGYVLQSLRTFGILYMLYYLVVLIYIAWKTNSLGRANLSGKTKNSNRPAHLEQRDSIGVVFWMRNSYKRLLSMQSLRKSLLSDFTDFLSMLQYWIGILVAAIPNGLCQRPRRTDGGLWNNHYAIA